MPDDQNGQLGRAITSAVMIQFLTADSAGFVHLQIAFEQGTLAAIGAFAPKTSKHGRPHCVLGHLIFVRADVCDLSHYESSGEQRPKHT